jgi:hypothetical protein
MYILQEPVLTEEERQTLIVDLHNQVSNIESQLNEAVENEDYELADQFNTQLEQVHSQLAKLATSTVTTEAPISDDTVTTEDIVAIDNAPQE